MNEISIISPAASFSPALITNEISPAVESRIPIAENRSCPGQSGSLFCEHGRHPNRNASGPCTQMISDKNFTPTNPPTITNAPGGKSWDAEILSFSTFIIPFALEYSDISPAMRLTDLSAISKTAVCMHSRPQFISMGCGEKVYQRLRKHVTDSGSRQILVLFPFSDEMLRIDADTNCDGFCIENEKTTSSNAGRNNVWFTSKRKSLVTMLHCATDRENNSALGP
mmetsp:Transcript_5355/g.11852  ORF Transcript_5355/g.11852 Transcript_5355/m.11852 type:complete len:225 (+) Transcript_5355:7761-8435(+)